MTTRFGVLDNNKVLDLCWFSDAKQNQHKTNTKPTQNQHKTNTKMSDHFRKIVVFDFGLNFLKSNTKIFSQVDYKIISYLLRKHSKKLPKRLVTPPPPGAVTPARRAGGLCDFGRMFSGWV